MHLVDKMQNDVEPLVVDPHIVLEVVDEARAGEVKLGEVPFRRAGGGDQPPLLDADLVGRAVEARPLKELALIHEVISLRGS